MSEDYLDSFLSGATSGAIIILFGLVFLWIISVSRIRKPILTVTSSMNTSGPSGNGQRAATSADTE